LNTEISKTVFATDSSSAYAFSHLHKLHKLGNQLTLCCLTVAAALLLLINSSPAAAAVIDGRLTQWILCG